MKTLLFVISDLHLGGDADFRICGEKGQQLLAGFLKWVAAQAVTTLVHLVVNGDSVDFLAEQPFSAFTSDQTVATQKLAKILEDTKEVWDGFASVVKSGARVTFLLGNHDLELSLPEPRRFLLDRLGPGQVEFLYDNQALTVGDVLIEHGNQYDRWNKTDDNGLRQTRAHLSRHQEIGNFKPPPGSRLVFEIMNQLKQEFSFINLLKPENQAAIPILGILRPSVIARIRKFAPLLLETVTRTDTAEVAGEIDGAPAGVQAADQEALDFAKSLAFDEDDMGAVSGSLFETLKDKWRGEKRKQQVETFRKAISFWMGPNLIAFDTQQEGPEYLNAAENSAALGFKVVTYGHTHLAKRMALAPGTAKYLNSGTWADMMSIPDDLLLAGGDESRQKLEGFFDDLLENRLDNWVNRVPTFVRVELEDGKSVDADVWLYSGGDQAQRMPDGRLSRLLARSAAAGN